MASWLPVFSGCTSKFLSQQLESSVYVRFLRMPPLSLIVHLLQPALAVCEHVWVPPAAACGSSAGSMPSALDDGIIQTLRGQSVKHSSNQAISQSNIQPINFSTSQENLQERIDMELAALLS